MYHIFSELRAPWHVHDIQYKFFQFQNGHQICDEINFTFLAISVIEIRMGSLGPIASNIRTLS